MEVLSIDECITHNTRRLVSCCTAAGFCFMNTNTGFQSLPFQVSSRDGRNFELLAEAIYVSEDGTRYRLPVGTQSDGASTPKEIWSLIPPFGLYWPAAYLHDAAYRDALEVEKEGQWAKATLPKDKCDKLLLESMRSLGVGVVERDTIYEGVVIGGESSFKQDRQNEQAVYQNDGFFH